MRKLKDALRLKFEGGQSHQKIAGGLGISKDVVTKYVGLAVVAGLDWVAISAMDEAALERRLLACSRPSQTYAQADFGRLHQELGRKGVTLMQRGFQKLPGSRASVFAQIDAPALMALPVQPWEWAVFKTVRVHIDSHVEFEGHRYSVPNALVGLALELRVTAHAVEVLHRGERVASHMRCVHKGGFTTVTEHLPEGSVALRNSQ